MEITDEQQTRAREIKREIREMNATALTERLNAFEEKFHELDKKIESLHILLDQQKQRLDTETMLRMQLMAKGSGPTT